MAMVGATTWWVDSDLDGHGVAAGSVTGCDQPVGYASVSDDCDDADPAVWTGCTSGTCSSMGPDLDVYTAPVSYAPELHLVAVYEPYGGPTIRVENHRAGNILLVLNAYEPVKWDMENSARRCRAGEAATAANPS